MDNIKSIDPQVSEMSKAEIDQLAKKLDNITEGTPSAEIIKFPSNQGKLERSKEEITETGEMKKMNVLTDPVTGEQKIIGEADNIDKSFDDIINEINNSDVFDPFNTSGPITIDELRSTFDNRPETLLLDEIIEKGTNLDEDELKSLVELINKRIEKQDIKYFKELPPKSREMIEKYVKNMIGSSGGANITTAKINEFKNDIAEGILDETIMNIRMERGKLDFANQISKLYDDCNTDFDSRNKSYRESLDKIEDEEKRERFKLLLDTIDEAKNLTELKEFSKKCKIKKFDIEKPQRIINSFIHKYENSVNSIYDLNMVAKVLYRHLQPEGYTPNDINALFIAFCKQTQSYDVNDPVQHAYMYYVLYYAVMLDARDSKVYKDNIKEIMNNLRIRNPHING